MGEDFHYLRGGSHFYFYFEDFPRARSLKAIGKVCGVPVSFIIYANRMDRGVHLDVARADRIVVPFVRFKMHKRGHTNKVEFTDSRQKMIYEIERASFKYGELNYSTMCG